MASTYLLRTMGTATSRFTFTLSMWVKRSALGQEVFWSSYESNAYRFQLYFDSSDRLVVYSVENSVDKVEVVTSRKFRDLNGWYHIYIAIKSSEPTASDRVKVYINGERETSFDVANYQATTEDLNLGAPHYTLNIGRYGGGTDYFSGYMSHSYYIDGSIIDVTEFGSTDATTGEWKINTSPTIASYGNQGHFILKDNASPTDQSGNGNNFSGGGAIRDSEDCPSNVFATMNPLDNFYANATLSNGNTTVATDGTNETYITSTLAVSTGKYYWEVEFDAGSDNSFIGIIDRVSNSSSFQSYIDATNGISYKKNGAIYTNGGNMSGVNIGTYTTGDIISVAMDLDNNKLYFGKNGTWLNSGVPTSGSTGTGAFSINSSPTDGVYYAQVGDDNTGSQTLKCNFGNGHFGTTAVASAGTNASGNGIFEYDVPTGYTALSTKGLNL